jgi:hypothetical protein
MIQTNAALLSQDLDLFPRGDRPYLQGLIQFLQGESFNKLGQRDLYIGGYLNHDAFDSQLMKRIVMSCFPQARENAKELFEFYFGEETRKEYPNTPALYPTLCDLDDLSVELDPRQNSLAKMLKGKAGVIDLRFRLDKED